MVLVRRDKKKLMSVAPYSGLLHADQLTNESDKTQAKMWRPSLWTICLVSIYLRVQDNVQNNSNLSIDPSARVANL